MGIGVGPYKYHRSTGWQRKTGQKALLNAKKKRLDNPSLKHKANQSKAEQYVDALSAAVAARTPALPAPPVIPFLPRLPAPPAAAPKAHELHLWYWEGINPPQLNLPHIGRTRLNKTDLVQKPLSPR